MVTSGKPAAPEPTVVERVSIARLRELPGNARTHNERNLDTICFSLRRFGQTSPLLVLDDGVVIAGNGRLAAMKRMGWTECDVRFLTGWDEPRARAYALADNRTAELAGWDMGLLREQLSLSLGCEIPLLELGWDADEARRVMRTGEQEPEDEVPPAPKVATTRLGDLWTLGPHRVLCASSLEPAAIGTVCGGGGVVDLVWTDPPFGVAIVGGSHALPADKRRKAGKHTIENDDLDLGALTEFLRSALRRAFDACRPGSAWYVAAPSGPMTLAFATVLTELGVWQHTLIWVKDSLVLGRCDYHYRHEQLYYGWRQGAAHTWRGARAQDTVLEFARPKASPEHPTIKPLGLVARCIENSSAPDALVLDPFGGSGTTLLAADSVGRRACVVELSPNYCDVILARWMKRTGGQPVLADGRTFAEVAADRG